MAKKVAGEIKLQIPGGDAKPAPPVGPALGQLGVPIVPFCKEFNARSQKQAGMIVPVVISVYQDRSFTFVMKTPPAAILIKKELGLAIGGKPGSGSPRPHKDKVGKITREQLEEIAKTKWPDLNAGDAEAAIRTIAGSARSMGVEVEGV